MNSLTMMGVQAQESLSQQDGDELIKTFNPESHRKTYRPPRLYSVHDELFARGYGF